MANTTKKRSKGKGGVRAMNASKWRYLLFLVFPAFLLYLYICIVRLVNSIAYSVYDWNGY